MILPALTIRFLYVTCFFFELTWFMFVSLTLLGVRFPESSKEEVQDQKQLLKDAAAFLLSCQIPGLVRN